MYKNIKFFQLNEKDRTLLPLSPRHFSHQVKPFPKWPQSESPVAQFKSGSKGHLQIWLITVKKSFSMTYKFRDSEVKFGLVIRRRG